jgi:receptor expression-enhancing protein 5/6
MAINLETLQVKAKQQLKDLDTELSKYKVFNDIEAKTKVQKTHIALGGAAIVFIMVFFNLAGSLITNLIGWLYPGKCDGVSYLMMARRREHR